MTDNSNDLEKLNQELIEKRKANKSDNEPVNDMQTAIEHAFKMAELSKNKPAEAIQPKPDIIPRINNMMPKRYAAKFFDNYIGNDDVKSKLIQNAKLEKSALIAGGVGTGKTHLAICYARLLIKTIYDRSEYFPTLKITTIAEMLSSILDKVKTIDEFKKVDVLIIDDLGAESAKEWTIDKIFELINYRYMQELPTIITTNLNAKELSEKIGIRTVSRIVEMCDKYQLSGEDYRLKRS